MLWKSLAFAAMQPHFGWEVGSVFLRHSVRRRGRFSVYETHSAAKLRDIISHWSSRGTYCCALRSGSGSPTKVPFQGCLFWMLDGLKTSVWLPPDSWLMMATLFSWDCLLITSTVLICLVPPAKLQCVSFPPLHGFSEMFWEAAPGTTSHQRKLPQG